MSYFAYIDQKIIPAHEAKMNAADLGLLRGFGIFDYFRLSGGCPLYMEDYLNRFVASAQALHIPNAPDLATLKEAVQTLLSHNTHTTVGVRLLLTGDVAEDFYMPRTSKLVLFTEPFKVPPADAYDNGIKVKLLDFERFSPRIKTTSYLPSISAMLAPGHKAKDILYHKNGYLSELSRSNLFIVKNKVIYTPNAGVLMGITRSHVIKLARSLDFIVVEKPIALADISEFDECFMTSTTKRIVPITTIDEHTIANGKPGVVTRRLLEALIAFEQDYIEKHLPKDSVV